MSWLSAFSVRKLFLTNARANTNAFIHVLRRNIGSSKTMASGCVRIDATPDAGQLVEHGGKIYTTIKEGRAFILVPPNARTSVDPQAKSKAEDRTQVQSVFYNPIQQFNRDLSILAIRVFGEDLCAKKIRKHQFQKDKLTQKQERKSKTSADEATRHENGFAGHKRKRDDDDTTSLSRPETVVRANAEEALLKSNARVAGDVPGQSHVTLDAVRQQTINGESRKETVDVDNIRQSHWVPGFRILDALSATGLRALRYASEIPFATSVVANDMDKNAVKSIHVNVQHNKLTSAIETSTGDAMAHMYRAAFPPENSHGPTHRSNKYDVIDLDPYGTAVPFIDAALQALVDGGLLCVTCTDSAVWASCGYSEKTFSLYGGMPIKGVHSHEGGLRLILHSIATAAAKYSLAIEPLLSLSIDFYARVFVRVRKSAGEVKFVAGKTMLVYGCDAGCGAWSVQTLGRHVPHKNNDANWKYSVAQAPSADKLCPHCGSKTHVAGPMWGGPIHNPAFIERMLLAVESCDEETYQTKKRIDGMLDTALDELSIQPLNFPKPSTNAQEQSLIPSMPPEAIDHHPFYFVPSALCKVIRAQAPKEAQLKGALRHLGYTVARTHCRAGSIKTDAPWSVIWEVMREWVRQKSPIKEGALKEGQPGFRILQDMRSSSTETSKDDETSGHSMPAGQTVASADPGNESPQQEQRVNAKKMKVIFDEKLGQVKPGRRLVRYQQNPRENWGPMARAKGSG